MLTCQVTCFSLENLLYRKAEKKRKFPERKRESHASNVLMSWPESILLFVKMIGHKSTLREKYDPRKKDVN